MTRRIWHYDEKAGGLVEGPGARRVDGHSGDGWRYSDRYRDGDRAPDGTDLSTRKKHRDYMRKNNLTTVDDFKETWKKQAEERASYFTGTNKRESEQRKQDIADAINRRTRNG